MKKLFAALCALLLLAGCASKRTSGEATQPVTTTALFTEETTQEPQQPTESEPTEALPTDPTQTDPAPTEAPFDRETAIKDAYSAEGIYTDDIGNESSYSYHIPCLNADTADAEAINSEIMDSFYAQAQIDELDGTSIINSEIKWVIYWQGQQCSLLVSIYCDWGFYNYKVYSYDFATGRRLGSEELVQQAGLTQDEFLAQARLAAASCFDTKYSDYSYPEDEFYQTQRQWTISDENIRPDMQVYFDDNGQLMLISDIGALAGASSYEHTYPLFP